VSLELWHVEIVCPSVVGEGVQSLPEVELAGSVLIAKDIGGCPWSF